MAENESLDLGNPNARRWDAVYDAIRKGQPCEKVAKQVRTKLHQGLRKALKQFAEKGVSLEDLLNHRDSPASLRQFLKKSGGHEYIELFAETALAEKGSDTHQFLEAFVGGVWETISDQIAQNVINSERWSNFVDVEIFLNEVRSQIEPDVQRAAQKLAADPSWMPTCKPDKNGEKTDPTADMLGMSLLGIQK